MTHNVIVGAAAAAILVLASAGSASAQSVSPGSWNQASGSTYTWSGAATLFSTITLSCTTSAISTVSPGSGANATTNSTDFPFSGGFLNICSTVKMLDKSWPTVIGTSTDGGVTWPVTISGLHAKTTTGGECVGDLTGTFNETKQELVIGGDLVPGTASCEVDLVLKPSPALYIAP